MYLEINRILTATPSCLDLRVVDAKYIATIYVNVSILIDVDHGIRSRTRKDVVHVTITTRIESSLSTL